MTSCFVAYTHLAVTGDSLCVHDELGSANVMNVEFGATSARLMKMKTQVQLRVEFLTLTIKNTPFKIADVTLLFLLRN